MGSPVSAVVANLYMEFFEELTLRSAPAKPRLWKRYVDDTCCIVKTGTVEGLLDHLSSIKSSIRFTVAVEKDGGLPFLDTLLQRERMMAWMSPSTGSPHTLTDTWTLHVKSGLVKCLYDRARSITTRQNNLQKKECHLTEVLK